MPNDLQQISAFPPEAKQVAPKGIMFEDLQRLQNQDLEHHHRFKGRPAAFGAIGALQRLGQRFPASHHRVQLLQWIASLSRT